jgi:hypothetical protein
MVATIYRSIEKCLREQLPYRTSVNWIIFEWKGKKACIDAVTSFFFTGLWDLYIKKSYFTGRENIVGVEWRRRKMSAAYKSSVPEDIAVGAVTFLLVPAGLLFIPVIVAGYVLCGSLVVVLVPPYLTCRLAYEAYTKASPALRKAYA